MSNPTPTPTPAAPAPVSAERLREIRERLAKATPGPWRLSDRSRTGLGIATRDGDWLAQTFNRQDEDHPNPYHNARFIAHAPQDIRDLLAALDAATAALATIEQSVEDYDQPANAGNFPGATLDDIRDTVRRYRDAARTPAADVEARADAE